MSRTGTATLPLHGGKAPAWLFGRMVKMAREIARIIIENDSPEGLLKKISDPFWFQALGCVLGFDWHSSGVTTTVCGALKEGLKGLEKDLDIFIAGGKGKASRKTPSEIENYFQKHSIKSEAAKLVYASRISAKVDSNALQDGYRIYQHSFLFTKNGSWTVVQQGMNPPYARRYHWLSDNIKEFTVEPHNAITSDKSFATLNLTATESIESCKVITGISVEKPEKTLKTLNRLKELKLPSRHYVSLNDIHTPYLEKILLKTYENPAKNFEELLGREGVGAKTLRALALIGELVYNVKPSVKDPARFSFAVGGKDGYPYPVAKDTYDRCIELLSVFSKKSSIELTEREKAVKRLMGYVKGLRCKTDSKMLAGSPPSIVLS